MAQVKVVKAAIAQLQLTPPGSAAWGSIGGTLSAQTDLAGALNGKASSSHDHGATYAATDHAHEGYVAEGDERLTDARLPIVHEHSATDISGTAVVDSDARLTDARTPTTHSHAQDDVTGLSGALEGKAAADHDHDSSYSAAGHNHDSAYSAIDHTHAAGSDPWTFVTLVEYFTSSLTANTAVTGLYFTPAINKTYYVIGTFMLRTATTTVGARPGIAWPTNLTDGSARMEAANSLTASALRSWGAKTTQNAASTGLATTADSHFGGVEALMVTSGTTSGNFQITLASETAGTNVTMCAGSFIAYREIA